VNRIAVLGVVALCLIVVGSQAHEIRSSLNGVATGWFHSLQRPGRQANAQKLAWEVFATRANALCGSYADRDLQLKVMYPQDRAQYVKVASTALEKQQRLQEALSRLQAPPNYDVSYRRFLQDRQEALVAVEHLIGALQKKERAAAIRALRAYAAAAASGTGFTQTAGLPACVV
jgi:hypothetical protein